MLQNILAICDLMTFLEEKESVEPQKVIEPKYKYYKFHCHLCSGETKFKSIPPSIKTVYTLECCRCGLENRVSIDV